MAVSKIDDLSPVERNLVVISLNMKHTSLLRAEKAATGTAVKEAYAAEAREVLALLNKFR